MIRNKILILTLLFSLSALLPAFSGQVHLDKPGDAKLDSIRVIISSRGWDFSLLEAYRNYLINTEENLSIEKEKIAELPGNFQREYLLATLLKREGKFGESFEKLSDILAKNPEFIPYFDDLIFSAAASGNIDLLQSKISSMKPGSFGEEYLKGMLDYNSGKYSGALAVLKKLSAERPGDKYLLFHLSYAFRYTGDYVSALKTINEAIASNNNDLFFVPEARLAAGALYYLSGKYTGAKKLYKTALDAAVSGGNKYGETIALVDIAIVDDQEGNIEEARADYSRALDIAARYNFMDLKALVYSELGVSCTFTNELLKAKQYYLKSYSLYRHLGNNLRLSLLSDNIARLFLSEFNYSHAEKLYRDGLEYAGDNKRAMAVNLVGLADVYANLSNYSKALEYYSRAKKITDEIKDLNLLVEINGGLGSLNYNLNNFGSAAEYFKKAVSLSLGSGDPYSLAEAYHNLGLAYSGLDSTTLAVSNLKKAGEISEKYSDTYTVSLSLLDLAYVYTKSGQNKNALSLLEKAEKLATRNGYNYLANASAMLKGKIYESGNEFGAAEKIYREILPQVKEINEPNLLIELHYLLAGVYEKNKKLPEAEREYREAIAIIGRISKALYSRDQVQISYFTSKSDVYNAYADLLIKEKKYGRAFLVIDRSRSRNTIQNLFNLKLESYDGSGSSRDELYDYEWIINSGLYPAAEVDSVRILYDKYKTSLLEKFPRLREIFSGEPGFDMKSIEKNLGNGEYLVSYYFSKDKLFAFLVGKNEFRAFPLGVTREELSSELSKISPYFGRKGRGVYFNQDLFSYNSKYSKDLYDKIIRPVLGDVKKNSGIIFSPCPELLSVPLEFLATDYAQNLSPYDYSHTRYLVSDYEISYTPSVRLYIYEKGNRLKNNDRILIVGNPTIDNQKKGYSERRGLMDEGRGLSRDYALLPLKYSEDEVSEISTTIKADKILLENDATETNFKMNADYSKIIHLSTHSFLINDQPVIFLSNNYDKRNDGLLEAGEIVKMKLNSDLVVLSSCNSGLGKLNRSEGILGMTKAFYEAGVKSVIVSLWPVNDRYTSRLMALFYENLAVGMSKSEALRNAKIKFINKYSANPYYWSAFVLSGNTSGVQLDKKIGVTGMMTVLALVLLFSLLFVLVRKRNLLNENHAFTSGGLS